MYVIETEVGRFEADTEREAKKQLRKAEREKQKQDAIDEHNLEIAQLRADAHAFRVLEAICCDGYAWHHPWIIRKGENYFPAEKIPDSYERYRVFVDNSRQVGLELGGYEPVAVLIRNSGDVALLWTESTWDDQRTLGFIAVGYEADQVATRHINKPLTPEDFETA